MGRTWKIRTTDQHEAAIRYHALGLDDTSVAHLLNAMHGCDGIAANGCLKWRRRHWSEIMRRREALALDLLATIPHRRRSSAKAA